MPMGFALAGVLTDTIGPVLVFVIGGSSTVALALLAYLHPACGRWTSALAAAPIEGRCPSLSSPCAPPVLRMRTS